MRYEAQDESLGKRGVGREVNVEREQPEVALHKAHQMLPAAEPRSANTQDVAIFMAWARTVTFVLSDVRLHTGRESSVGWPVATCAQGTWCAESRSGYITEMGFGCAIS